jgi:hypothetical protein
VNGISLRLFLWNKTACDSTLQVLITNIIYGVVVVVVVDDVVVGVVGVVVVVVGVVVVVVSSDG